MQKLKITRNAIYDNVEKKKEIPDRMFPMSTKSFWFTIPMLL